MSEEEGWRTAGERERDQMTVAKDPVKKGKKEEKQSRDTKNEVAQMGTHFWSSNQNPSGR